jgi:hypothetical protein
MFGAEHAYTDGRMREIGGDQKVSVHLMLTVQKTCKNIFKQFQSRTVMM